jgi:DNA-binding CsgD family transcriptional regulator
MTYNRLGDLARCEDDYGRADALYKESLALFTAMGDNRQMASVSHNIAHVRLSQGKVAHAARLFTQALDEFRAMDDKNGVSDCLAGLAGVAILYGRPEKGAQWLSASERAKQALGTTWWPANQIAYQRQLSQLHEQLDETTFQAAWERGRTLTIAQASAEAEQMTTLENPPAAIAFAAHISAPAKLADLTPREIEVLRLVARGLSNDQIAETLVLSSRTVHAHMRSILSKLDVTTRTAAARVAMDHKLV